jgi:tartrate dehydrogenase/decarboxylase/D-malate dehydrogenase
MILTRRTQHADILSDLAAALAGSIGIAPTANLDPTRQNPSMFGMHD